MAQETPRVLQRHSAPEAPKDQPGFLVEAAAAAKLSPLGHRLFWLLAGSFSTWYPNSAITDALYADDPEGGPLNLHTALRQIAAHVEKRLEPTALALERRAFGLRLVWR